MKAAISVLLTIVLLVLATIPVLADGPDNPKACWGQATRVFAQMGEMGEHASQQPTPRIGLRNLARALFEQGVIEDDSMQALGRFVTSALGLSIDACL